MTNKDLISAGLTVEGNFIVKGKRKYPFERLHSKSWRLATPEWCNEFDFSFTRKVSTIVEQMKAMDNGKLPLASYQGGVLSKKISEIISSVTSDFGWKDNKGLYKKGFGASFRISKSGNKVMFRIDESRYDSFNVRSESDLTNFRNWLKNHLMIIDAEIISSLRDVNVDLSPVTYLFTNSNKKNKAQMKSHLEALANLL